MRIALTPLAATLTFAVSGSTHPRFALYAVITGLVTLAGVVAVVYAERSSRWMLIAWHRSRAATLRDQGAGLSGLWPLVWVVFLALSLLEWGHLVRVEALL